MKIGHAAAQNNFEVPYKLQEILKIEKAQCKYHVLHFHHQDYGTLSLRHAATAINPLIP